MPTRADLLKDLMLIQKRLNVLFEEPHGDFEPTIPPISRAGCWSPAIDCYETDDKFIVTAELPGVERQDLDLQVRGRKIILSGERKPGQDVPKENYHRVECASGKFERTIELSVDVNASMIDATLTDGVLRITLPKQTPSPRRIRIEKAE
jgi:HSP20 family protein